MLPLYEYNVKLDVQVETKAQHHAGLVGFGSNGPKVGGFTFARLLLADQNDKDRLNDAVYSCMSRSTVQSLACVAYD